MIPAWKRLHAQNSSTAVFSIQTHRFEELGFTAVCLRFVAPFYFYELYVNKIEKCKGHSRAKSIWNVILPQNLVLFLAHLSRRPWFALGMWPEMAPPWVLLALCMNFMILVSLENVKKYSHVVALHSNVKCLHPGKMYPSTFRLVR